MEQQKNAYLADNNEKRQMISDEIGKYIMKHNSEIQKYIHPIIDVDQDCGFLGDRFESFKIDPASIKKMPLQFDGTEVYLFTGCGVMIYDEPASRIPDHKDVRFGGEALLQESEGRESIKAIIITTISK